MKLKDLLARGYFPKELPRPFVTAHFADAVSSTAAPPGDFAKTIKTGNKIPTGKTARYSHARGGLLRRPLHICNPLHYFLLCKELTQYWALIRPKVAGTVLSATSPSFKTTGRAIDGKWPQGARPDLAQNTRLGRRYILQTDINRFYNSIYTHSISWALHTKAKTKANRTFGLLGNRIDYMVRMGQDQQTVGIPIGPDTSLLIAELLMQRCDEQLLIMMPTLKGHRFIDDYEISFQTRTEAEDAFHMLENCLAEYELALNPKKTHVLELPLPLEPPWAIELKRFAFRATSAGQAADLSHYFSKVYSLQMENPGEAVLQFAAAKFRSVSILPANWVLFQKLLLLCVIPQPASFPYVLEQIISRKNTGATPILDELHEIVHALIIDHSSLKHSSEVSNALWACLAFGLKLDQKAANAISGCDDPVVALLALDCEQHGLVPGSLDKTVWALHMTPEALYDDHWLLSYEANVKGWLPTLGGGDHVKADANFRFLKKANVQFYDANLASAPPASPTPMPALPAAPRLSSSYS